MSQTPLLTLETNRTILRPFAISDLLEAQEWFSDPEVMRHIPNGPDKDVDATKTRIKKYMDHQNIYGFSKWIVIDRVTQRPIGDSGIMWLEQFKRFELGYRLRKEFWGRGLATEIANAWIFSLPIVQEDLIAFAHAQNPASQKILKKLGFKELHIETILGMECMIFSLL